MVEEKEGDEQKPGGLKPAQVVASAMAAVTAAFLGSTLGVAGTIAGAGMASLVTTIGSEVFLRSLRKTREAARRTKEVLLLPDTRLRQETRLVEPPPARPANPLIRRPGLTPPGREDRTRFIRPSDPGAVPGQGDPRAPARRVDPGATAYLGERPGSGTRQSDATVRLPRPDRAIPVAGQGASDASARTVFIPARGSRARSGASSPAESRTEARPRPEHPWWKSRWMLLAGTCVAAFVVGMLALTGFETATGHTISGAPGTTIGQLGRAGHRAPTETPTTTVPDTTTSETPTGAGAPPVQVTTTPEPSSTKAGSAPTSAANSAPSSVSATPTPGQSQSPSASPTSP